AELDLRAGRCDAAGELVAGLHDPQRDVAVPDEDEWRVGELERRERGLVAEDVLPDRVARRAVVEGDAVSRALGLEAVEQLLPLRLQHATRPRRRQPGVAVELLEVERPADGEIMVARKTDVGALGDRRAALVRPRPVADEIAEAPELVRRLLVDRRED